MKSIESYMGILGKLEHTYILYSRYNQFESIGIGAPAIGHVFQCQKITLRYYVSG